MAGELAAEWIKIPDGNGNLQKVWVRDSTARRDIAQLQTDVSGKADAATTLAGYGITDAYTKTQVDGMIPSVPSAYTSNPSMDGTASPGSSTAWARGDHVHPHDSTKADASAIPTKTSDLTNDSGFITASAVPDPSSAAPAMDGTAAAGSSTDYARADHVHPSDTSKQDTLTSAQLAAVNSGITADDLAVNNPSVLCNITPIYPTLDAGTNSSALGNTFYYKIGRRVHVHIALTGLSSATTTTIFTLPAGYIPLVTSGFTCLGTSYTTYSRIRVNGASTSAPGAVTVNGTGSGVLADFDFDAFA